MPFSSIKRRKIEVNFDGGEITSDGGIILLREIDKKINLTKQTSQFLTDHRNKTVAITAYYHLYAKEFTVYRRAMKI